MKHDHSLTWNSNKSPFTNHYQINLAQLYCWLCGRGSLEKYVEEELFSVHCLVPHSFYGNKNDDDDDDPSISIFQRNYLGCWIIHIIVISCLVYLLNNWICVRTTWCCTYNDTFPEILPNTLQRKQTKWDKILVTSFIVNDLLLVHCTLLLWWSIHQPFSSMHA